MSEPQRAATQATKKALLGLIPAVTHNTTATCMSTAWWLTRTAAWSSKRPPCMRASLSLSPCSLRVSLMSHSRSHSSCRQSKCTKFPLDHANLYLNTDVKSVLTSSLRWSSALVCSSYLVLSHMLLLKYFCHSETNSCFRSGRLR